MTDSQGKVVWSVSYKAYGSLALKHVNEIENPIRFQGQYHDIETGLHYNRHRYYDPNCGQFITQDPIGLVGGLNSYRYVPNPTSWVDPLGLIVVYRNLRADENPAEGLTAKKPSRNMTVDGHVRTGSRNNGSQFISTTTAPEVAAKWNEAGQQTVMFDTDNIVPDELGNKQVIDISTREKAATNGVKGVPLNFVGDSKEVLVVGKVPPSAMTTVDIKTKVSTPKDCSK